MFKIIVSILTQKSGLPFAGPRPSRWFEWKVKLGCALDVLQARYLPHRKHGSQSKLKGSVTARYTPSNLGKLRS